MSPAQPSSFDLSVSVEWEQWCIKNGLPTIPDIVQPGESIPVSVWRDGDIGAVLFVRHIADIGEGEPSIESEMVAMHRSVGGWAALASGGGTWPGAADLSRSIPTFEGVVADGILECRDEDINLVCATLFGVPTAGASICINRAGSTWVTPAICALGAQVVCAEPPFAAWVLDAAGVSSSPLEFGMPDSI